MAANSDQPARLTPNQTGEGELEQVKFRGAYIAHKL